MIFLDFLSFKKILLSPHVKRWAIITYTYGMFQLPHEFQNNLGLRILANYEIFGKCLSFIE